MTKTSDGYYKQIAKTIVSNAEHQALSDREFREMVLRTYPEFRSKKIATKEPKTATPPSA